MMEFCDQERRELLQLARHTIELYLARRKKEYPPVQNSHFMEKRGVFVTLHRQGELRGCIGYPLPYKPLWEAVVENAISAAFEDPRFVPLDFSELPEIDIELSILTIPHEAKSVDEVIVGRDGIIISKGMNRGLLLPQVPVEQRWNREQYLSYGCLKAGLAADEWRIGVKLETFQAEVFGERME